ncbi:MAG TPA: molybdopterin synthase catalytic subunit MoaE [Rhodocyclaceae bacterium]|jgi:molybdopterin synthase catalytic subunit|nr:molybdopterin synthase catalytic subunit MoaE [Rhodocyclaceae bacterium]
MQHSVSVQEADFDLSAEVKALTAGNNLAGAVASFVGLVRDNNDGTGVADMTLEHYPGMTEKALDEIAIKAGERWELLGVRIIHRVGHLMPGDQIVLVVVSSPHRGNSFAACEFIMDYLKTQAPFWKKETTAEGSRWVDARVSDDEAMAKWRDQIGM